MFPLTTIVIASQVAAQAVAAEHERRRAAGLPPLEAPPVPVQPPGFDWAGFWLWVMILAPGVLFAGVFGMIFFVVMKVALASKGIPFP